MSESNPKFEALSQHGMSAAAAAETPDLPAPDPSSPVPVAEQLKSNIVTVLKTVYDPEIPVDIYELGLIYSVEVDDAQEVSITMTLTSPMCPVAEILPPEVEAKVRAIEGVKDVDLEVVWDPPWSPDMMSEAARLELNYF